jgi:hypothetical protein
MVQAWNYQDRHRRNVPVIVAKSDAICELYNLWDRENDREPERLANARLIAAAPDMLDALRRLTHPMASDEDLQHALSVIAKAEGRGEP